ncbi:5943_t:CDS:2, partial [Ambispora leptoticha]
ASLLERKPDEFPYVSLPNYEHLFEFMKKVFPPTIDSSGRVTGLEYRDYLDKPDDDSYLKPSSGKKAAYVVNNEGKPGFDSRLQGQMTPSKIIDISENEVLRVESDIEQVRKQISGISSDNATLQLEIDALEDYINLLKSMGEDEDKPIDTNKSDFETVYNEKDKQDGK